MDKPTQVVVARLIKPHGLRGEIETQPTTDFEDRLLPGRRLLLAPVRGDRDHVTIENVRPKKHRLLLKLTGIDTEEDASSLRGSVLVVPVSELPPLDEGEFYHHELLGMRVETTDGRELGSIAEILRTGANDVYVVRNAEGTESLIPAISACVKDVDVEGQCMTVEPMPGLLEEVSGED